MRFIKKLYKNHLHISLMQKSEKNNLVLSVISVFLGVLLMNFISAQGISGLLDYVGGENISLFIIFAISGILLKILLGKSLGEDNKLVGILSLLLAFGITAMVHFSGFAYYFDINNLFYSIGFSEGLVSTIVSLALIGGATYIFFKYDFGTLLIILGGFLLILSATDFIYETGTTVILGLFFLGVGVWLKFKKRPGIGQTIIPAARRKGPWYP